MAIGFNEIPNAIRTPFVYVEIDGSQAFSGPSIMPFKALFLGQMLATGNADAEIPVLVTSADKAGELFGEGSLLHRQFIAWFKNNNVTPAYAFPFEDPAGATKSTGSITIGGSISVAGTLSFYIAGERIQVGVKTTDTLATIATSLANAINAKTNLPVTAAVNGSTDEQVDITAKNGGPYGDDISLKINVFGEETPGSLTVTVSEMSSGAGLPDLSSAWAKLGDEHYNVWINPYTDAASLTAIETELDDRNGPLRQIDAVAFSALSGSHSAAQTFGNGRNSRFVSVLATQSSPTPSFEVGAAFAAVASKSLEIDPARPLQTLDLSGVIPPTESSRFTRQERNLLLFDGVSTSYVDAGGVVRLERAITMYQENAQGANDIAYLDVNTLFTLSYLRYDFRNYFLVKYPRHKLADDGIRFGAGQPIITPKIAKAEAVRRFREWERQGLVEGIDQFKENIIVERNDSDPNRLDFMLPPDLVNQLRVMGVQIKFLLD